MKGGVEKNKGRKGISGRENGKQKLKAEPTEILGNVATSLQHFPGKVLEWWPFPSPRDLMSPALAGGFLTTSATWEAMTET